MAWPLHSVCSFVLFFPDHLCWASAVARHSLPAALSPLLSSTVTLDHLPQSLQSWTSASVFPQLLMWFQHAARTENPSGQDASETHCSNHGPRSLCQSHTDVSRKPSVPMLNCCYCRYNSIRVWDAPGPRLQHTPRVHSDILASVQQGC